MEQKREGLELKLIRGSVKCWGKRGRFKGWVKEGWLRVGKKVEG